MASLELTPAFGDRFPCFKIQPVPSSAAWVPSVSPALVGPFVWSPQEPNRL